MECAPQYEAGTDGQIRNIDKGNILKGYPDEAGYVCVGSHRKFFVHRLVADAFLPVDNHIDHVRDNNNLSVLNKTNTAEKRRVRKLRALSGRCGACANVPFGSSSFCCGGWPLQCYSDQRHLPRLQVALRYWQRRRSGRRRMEGYGFNASGWHTGIQDIFAGTDQELGVKVRKDT